MRPSLRIFAARLAFQMRPSAQTSPDMPLTVLMDYLEGLAESGHPVSAVTLAEAVEFAMKTVAQ